MKVEKIDIKKELMEIPDGERMYKFAVIDQILAYNRLNEKCPDHSTIKEETYEVVKIQEHFHEHFKENNIDGVKTYYYLVKLSDKKLFENILKIEEDKLNSYLYEKISREKNKMISQHQNNIEDYTAWIKGLSWFRRLFNLFDFDYFCKEEDERIEKQQD